MFKAYYIKRNHYDFTDKDGKHIVGNNIDCFCDGDIVRARCNDEQYKALASAKFGDIVELDVRVKGKFAKYILAN